MTQPIRQVAEGIYQVRIPLPFALNHVNCYLLQRRNGSRPWTVLDTGLNGAQARRTWQLAFQELRIDPSHDIEQIVLTHMHPDHFGLAGWFEQQSAAPVLISPIDGEQATKLWYHDEWRIELIGRHWRRAGVPESELLTIGEPIRRTRDQTRPPAQEAGTARSGR